MMYQCEKCGHILEESDLKRVSYEIDDRAVPTEFTDLVCPCGGDVYDVERCSECGEYAAVELMYNDLCENCQNKKEEE